MGTCWGTSLVTKHVNFEENCIVKLGRPIRRQAYSEACLSEDFLMQVFENHLTVSNGRARRPPRQLLARGAPRSDHNDETQVITTHRQMQRRIANDNCGGRFE
jgi:hypothetical protein